MTSRHDVTDPNAPLGYQCGDPACREHGTPFLHPRLGVFDMNHADRYRFATPRPGEDVLTRVPRRTGVPQSFVGPAGNESRRGTPYRMAHEVRPEPLPTNRSRIAPDLLALAVILAVVLAASLAGVRL